MDFTTNKKGNSGPKPKYNQEILVTAIRQTPLSQRRTLRSLSNATLIPQSTLGVMRQKGWFLRHSNAVKPFLTYANKIAHLQFVKSFVNPLNQHFNTMYDYVYIDEKWFYMTKCNAKFYVFPGETPPHQTCKSKRYITKGYVHVCCRSADMGQSFHPSFRWQDCHMAFHSQRACEKKNQESSSRYNGNKVHTSINGVPSCVC